MTVYLDDPLPDEILFSVIARYINRTGIEYPSRFVKTVMGKDKQDSDDRDDFSHLAAETAHPWGMCEEEIRNRLTLLPFYSACFPWANDIDIIKKGVGGTSWSGYLTPRRPGLRYCEECWSDDDRNGHARYWRRVHQLPGVITCALHGQILLVVGLPFSRNLLTLAFLCKGGSPVLSDKDGRLSEWHKVASLARKLLVGEMSWSNFGNLSSRVELTKRCGYVSNGKVDSGRLANDAFQRLGREYFSVVTSVSDIPAEFERAILSTQVRTRTPLYGLLLAYLLLDVSNRSMNVGEPDCPRSRLPRDICHHVTDWGTLDGRSHYLCSCGFSFTLESEEDEGQINPTQEGGDVALAVSILVAKSYSIQTLVKILGVPKNVLESMIVDRVEVRQWRRRTERAKWLAHWIELVYRCGGPDAAYANCAHVFHALGKLLEILPDTAKPMNARSFDKDRRVRGER